MKEEYANQRAWAIDGSYNQHFEKLKALKEGNFEEAKRIDDELKASSELYKAVRKALSLSEKIMEEYEQRYREIQAEELHTKN